MTKSKKNLAIVVALITLLVALGSLFAIFASPATTLEAAELTEAQLAERRANPGLYETGTMTLKKSWQQLQDDGDITISAYNTPELVGTQLQCVNKNLAGDLICGEASGLVWLEKAFSNCAKLTHIDCNKLDTSNVKSMNNMFRDCGALTTIELHNLNTSSVDDMQQMFSGCSAIISLNLSNFNTANVKNMANMFEVCTSLKALDVSGFNTSLVSNMQSMFASCFSLSSIDLRSFSTESNPVLAAMFKGCSSIELKFDKDKFKISNQDSGALDLMFCSASDYLKLMDMPQEYIDFILNGNTTREKRLDAYIELYNQNLEEDAEPVTVDTLKLNGDYYSTLAILADTSFNTIICPSVADGISIPLNPASNHFYALADDPTKAEVTELSSATNSKTLKLYYRDTKTEVPPVTNPDTPSETGVVADISMIIIALASILSLAVVATKKKRLAR